jgi:hypothetical protein
VFLLLSILKMVVSKLVVLKLYNQHYNDDNWIDKEMMVVPSMVQLSCSYSADTMVKWTAYLLSLSLGRLVTR